MFACKPATILGPFRRPKLHAGRQFAHPTRRISGAKLDHVHREHTHLADAAFLEPGRIFRIIFGRTEIVSKTISHCCSPHVLPRPSGRLDTHLPPPRSIASRALK